MKLKVCGMKYKDNTEAVAALSPDYLGFIFHEKSPRNFTTEICEVPNVIKKTGVFVDASLSFILEKVKRHGFGAVQLHGNETPKYCLELKDELDKVRRFGIDNNKNENIEIFKVFSIADKFDFAALQPYKGVVDYFLFDTKGKEKGGNGYPFDWSLLKAYPYKTPFILSGGIGLEETQAIKEMLKTGLPIYAIDINSRFETAPGLKNIEQLKAFIKQIRGIRNAKSCPREG